MRVTRETYPSNFGGIGARSRLWKCDVSYMGRFVSLYSFGGINEKLLFIGEYCLKKIVRGEEKSDFEGIKFALFLQVLCRYKAHSLAVRVINYFDIIK